MIKLQIISIYFLFNRKTKVENHFNHLLKVVGFLYERKFTYNKILSGIKPC